MDTSVSTYTVSNLPLILHLQFLQFCTALLLSVPSVLMVCKRLCDRFSFKFTIIEFLLTSRHLAFTYQNFNLKST